MNVQEVVPGVHQILVRMGPLPYVNAFLVEGDEGIGLFDCGMPKRADLILRAVAALRRKPEDLRWIAITHHHIDHTGSLRALARATGASVHVPGGDAAIIRGEATPPPANRATMAGRLCGPILERISPRYDPPGDPLEVGEGDTLPIGGGTTVIATPGHTAGHVSYLIPSKRLLIVGDAAGSLRGRVRPPLGIFTEDMEQAGRSMAKLAAMEFDSACFGHGGPLRGAASAAFRRAVVKRSR